MSGKSAERTTYAEGTVVSEGAAGIAHAVRVKLCGLSRPEDVAAANAAHPDYVGFVVDFPRSHRSVPACDLPVLSDEVEKGIRRVGVFVDEPIEVVARLYSQGAIDVAQLHGHENETYIETLRQRCDVPIIQAFRVRSEQDVIRAEASTADLVLLDNGQGTGEAFDWSFVCGVRRPFMLAGGLGPLNVAGAIAAVRPWGVDMSSGIETDGLKDPKKMAAAVAAARTFSVGTSTVQVGVSPRSAHGVI